MLQAMYFYKENNQNIPLGYYSESSDYRNLFNVKNDSWFIELQKDYPEIKDNLFVMIDGTEFKVPTV